MIINGAKGDNFNANIEISGPTKRPALNPMLTDVMA